MSALAVVFHRNRLMSSYLIVAALIAVLLLVSGAALSDRFLTLRNLSNLFQQAACAGPC